MKTRAKSSIGARFSASVLRDLQAARRVLERAVCRQSCLVQGSVNELAPKTSGGNTTYTWTRKVRAKTVTVALSREQSVAFRQAIKANRQLEAALSRLRDMSQTALLTEVPGVTKRRLDGLQNAAEKTVPKGA